jgi:hypothetical protein
VPIYGRLCTNVVVVLTIRIAGDEAPDDDRSTTRMVSKFSIGIKEHLLRLA